MIVIGLNHKTAPIEIREKFFLNHLEQDLFLNELKNNPYVVEAFALSTCNRTEVYLQLIDEGTSYLSYIPKLIAKIKKFQLNFDYRKNFYYLANQKAVEHLFKVASGLDSLVLGEKQILGQVKSAVERAQQKGTFAKQFNILFNLAIRAGKKAQTETEISFGGSSISWAAITLSEKILGTLKDKSILVIGAGKMGELALEQIRDKGASKIYLMNRTGCKAEALAQKYEGIAVSFFDMKEVLTDVDICFCSSGAPHYILEKEMVEKLMELRKGRPLLLVDISMPRNIDPQVAHVSQVKLVSLDDLDTVVGDNMKKRQAAAIQVQSIVDQKTNEFYEKLNRNYPGKDNSTLEEIEV